MQDDNQHSRTMRRAAILLALLAAAVLWLRRDREIGPYPLAPRHLDPSICHADWCATARTGEPDLCECWEAA